MSKFARLFAGLALGVMTLFAGVAEAHALLLSSKIEGQDVVLHFNGRVRCRPFPLDAGQP